MAHRHDRFRLFKNDQFDFDTRITLGSVYYGAADVGEVLSTAARVKDGDYESWFAEWKATGDRVRGIADEAAQAGHRVSAREAYLRSANYLFVATGSLDGTKDPDRLVPAWRAHRACWERFCSRWDPPIEQVAIPYEGTELQGFMFLSDGSGEARPTLIINNGSDGPVTGMWPTAAAALRRGYNAITFDGPGQGQALWEQEIPFRPDWESVIGPVIDVLEGRHEVDAARIAIYGISQAGFWVPRAAAFDNRLAAAVVDPGVMDVSTSWTDHLPKSMKKLLEEGEVEKFDKQMDFGEHFLGRTTRQTLAFRAKPYGKDSVGAVYEEVEKYNLRDVVDKITLPILITSPEDEQFWPGQSQELYDALPGPDKTIVEFSAAEGANWHCEPMAQSLLGQRMFDWLDERLGA
jgi:alpha-beta hydrolase superfamily lysophospholipase